MTKSRRATDQAFIAADIRVVLGTKLDVLLRPKVVILLARRVAMNKKSVFQSSGLTVALLVVFVPGRVIAAEIKPAAPARLVALRAIDALYYQADPEKAAPFFADGATQGNIRSPDSALEYIRKNQIALPQEGITLKEIVFFTEKDLDRMAKRFPDSIWKRSREPMKDALGCLAAFEVKTPRSTGVALGIMVLKLQKDEYKIVHIDDN